MKKPAKKKKKLRPRLPMKAVLKLRSHSMTTKKGKKGYYRRRLKKQAEEIINNEKT